MTDRWLSAGQQGPEPAAHTARKQTSAWKNEEETQTDIWHGINTETAESEFEIVFVNIASCVRPAVELLIK